MTDTARLRLDPASGRPVALVLRDLELALEVSASLLVGGDERPGASGGLEYPGAQWRSPEESGWDVRWVLRHDATADLPAHGLALELAAADGAPQLRDLVVELTVRGPDLDSWLLEVPGNRIRPSVPLRELGGTLGVSTATGLRGSPGLVALHDPDGARTLLVWAFATDELNTASMSLIPGGLRVRHDTGVAAAAPTTLTVSTLRVDLRAATWPEVRAGVPGWWAAVGIVTPDDSPGWAADALIFEAQLGFSVFGRTRYAPYPDVADLAADLDRIAGLGFDTVQLMPRQPYPSYNVHDYADVTTSYGDEDALRALVADAHARGMRVILDILMHGVVDRASVRRAADGVRNGPYAGRLDESVDLMAADLADPDAAAIPWSRHVLDFEPYWRAGSREHHRLTVEHPEWFTTDSKGRPTGVYTQAFDLSHPGWREYFTQSAARLVERLGIDGFRFDAPSYNDFPNWSPRMRARASAVTVGARGLFRGLRPRLRRLSPDLVLYTEPSGPMWRESMDLVYNYDEQWLLPAVMGALPEPWLRLRGADLAAWLRDRDATLPPRATTVHHIDSHDTFWWPLPGAKWRREQFGLPATRALLTVFMLCGGPFMSFVGAEAGLEDTMRALARLRRERPEIGRGAVDYEAVRADSPDVFAVVRRLGDDWSAVLVNLSPRARTVRCDIAIGTPAVDLLGGPSPRAWGDDAVRLDLEGYGVAVLAPASTSASGGGGGTKEEIE
jgi:glycosidase